MYDCCIRKEPRLVPRRPKRLLRRTLLDYEGTKAWKRARRRVYGVVSFWRNRQIDGAVRKVGFREGTFEEYEDGGIVRYL